MNKNLALNLVAAADRHPDRPALILADQTLTYAQHDESTARVAGHLQQRGIVPGDRIGVMLPNIPEFALAYYGALRAGAAIVPMNILLKEREVSFYVEDSGAKLVLSEGSLAELDAPALEEVAERSADGTAVILYTSGTTGKPKGAELTHASLAANAEVSARLFGLGSEDVILGALPLFHAFGQTCGLNAAVHAGAALALVPRFEPGRVLETIEREQVTIFEGVPTMYAALLHHPEREKFDVQTLRVCVSGGAALPVEILHEFERIFDCIVLEGYGLSETSPVACFNHPDKVRKPGSIGTPIEGVEMRAVDDQRKEVPQGEPGEIAIRGHNVMKGYWNRPEATAEAIDADGWFYTGDIGRIDEDGCYFIVDRKKELIIRGGYNVYPREIEEVLYEHPAVREAAVIGIAHDDLGEEVGAAVALKPAADADPDELREFVKERVAAYKYPRRVWFVDELPKGPTGKILKREITAPQTTASKERA